MLYVCIIFKIALLFPIYRKLKIIHLLFIKFHFHKTAVKNVEQQFVFDHYNLCKFVLELACELLRVIKHLTSDIYL